MGTLGPAAWARPHLYDCRLGQVKNKLKEICACKLREHNACIGNIWRSEQCLRSLGAGGWQTKSMQACVIFLGRRGHGDPLERTEIPPEERE